jgi:hypothetical protein
MAEKICDCCGYRVEKERCENCGALYSPATPAPPDALVEAVLSDKAIAKGSKEYLARGSVSRPVLLAGAWTLGAQWARKHIIAALRQKGE